MEIKEILEQKFGDDKYLTHVNINDQYTVAAFTSRVSGTGSNRKNDELYFIPFINGKRYNESYHSIEQAMIGMICKAKVKENSDARAFQIAIFKMLDLKYNYEE